MFNLVLTEPTERTYTYSTDSYRNLFSVVRNALALHHTVSVRLSPGNLYPIESLQDLIDILDIIK